LIIGETIDLDRDKLVDDKGKEKGDEGDDEKVEASKFKSGLIERVFEKGSRT